MVQSVADEAMRELIRDITDDRDLSRNIGNNRRADDFRCRSRAAYDW